MGEWEHVSRLVGLLGVGLLGSAVAERLLAAGHTVRGYDIDPARLCALEYLGGSAASSVADAVEGTDFVLTCLLTAEVVREALYGPAGGVEALRPGSVLIDLTTCSPADSRRLAADLAERGVEALDAPVSGSSSVVRAGEALVMAGGPVDTFQRSLPVLSSFAREVIHTGGSGSGSAAKLVTNLVLGLNRLALAEGMALGLRSGLEPEALLRLLRESAAYSRALDAKGERMVYARFEPEARLAQHLKDVDLILELAGELDLGLPATSLHAGLLREGVARGLGELDNSAIIEVIRRSSEAPS